MPENTPPPGIIHPGAFGIVHGVVVVERLWSVPAQYPLWRDSFATGPTNDAQVLRIVDLDHTGAGWFVHIYDAAVIVFVLFP